MTMNDLVAGLWHRRRELKKKKNDKDLETVKMYQYKDWIVTTIYKL